MKDTITQFIDIENAAHEGAFGINPIPLPSDAMCIAGNYKLGRTVIYGLKVSIEQPRHSYRTGIDPKTGKRWTNRLAAHYGFFSGTKGNDGDPVDCFIGFYPQSDQVYVINQYIDGKFDEHKCCICFPDEASSKRAYMDSYDKGWNGLHSMVTATISQFKWWLKNGNMKQPLKLEHLPYDGYEHMNKRIYWDSATGLPESMTLDQLLYQIRKADGGENLLLDAVTVADILEDTDGVLAFDALVTPYASLERKMNALMAVMSRASATVKPVALQITEPFKQIGVAQVAAIFELSDGQTVTIYFHNPDIDPRKIQQSDELVSWRFLLNKRDITIAAAPERGDDLKVREVARRIMKLAEKNSPAFQRANAKRAEKMQAIQSIKDEIVTLEQELKDAQHELEVAKIEAEDRAANRIDFTSPEGYAKIMIDESLQLAYQDPLDSLFQSRIIDVRNMLRELGWEGEEYGELSKNGYSAKFNFKHVGAGANVVGYWVSVMDGNDVQAEIGDKLTGNAADVAAQIDAVVTSSGTITANNYVDNNINQEEPETETEQEFIVESNEEFVNPEIEASETPEEQAAEQEEIIPTTETNQLPEGWTESRPGGMATNTDPASGGIVDKAIASGEWFAVANNDAIGTLNGFASRDEALAALAEKAAAFAEQEMEPAVDPQEVDVEAQEQAEEKEAPEDTVPEDVEQEDKPTLESLLAIGGKEWQSGDKHRVYFNDLAKRYGLDLNFYGTGNISSASLDGEKISNSKAKKIDSYLRFAKLWYDFSDNEFHHKDLEPKDFAFFVELIKDDLKGIGSDQGDKADDPASVELEIAKEELSLGSAPDGETPMINSETELKSAFEAELNALKLETDIEAFDKKLDEISGRIEQAGLMEEMDGQLNAVADRLTELLAEAEKNAA
jgi:hypothetical protein